jgi:L-lactate dehydrogenase complex protein LldF
MMRAWRERDFAQGKRSRAERLALKAWAFAARRPRLYHVLASAAVPLLAWLARGRGHFNRLPFAKAWTETRDLPAPEGKTFHQRYAETRRRHRQ